MALNQIVNAIAYTGNSSIADTVESLLDDKLIHTVYVDQSVGSTNGTGSFVRPVNSLANALSVSKNGCKWVIAGGGYDIPQDLLANYNLFLCGDRPQVATWSVKALGQLRLNGQCKDCYFKNITFTSGGAASSGGVGGGVGTNTGGPIIISSGYQGNIIFDQCRFVSGDNEVVISFGNGDSGTMVFNDCHFNKNSKVTNTGSGNGAKVVFIGANSIAPSIELSSSGSGYEFKLNGGECGKITHGAGKITLDGVHLNGFSDGQECIVSSAAAATSNATTSNAISLLRLNTQNQSDGNQFGKIVKTGDCLGWHCDIVKPTTFEHQLGNCTDISYSSKYANAGHSSNISVSSGAISSTSDDTGLEITQSGSDIQISLCPADATKGGAVTNAAQSFGGEKAFPDGLSARGSQVLTKADIPAISGKTTATFSPTKGHWYKIATWKQPPAQGATAQDNAYGRFALSIVPTAKAATAQPTDNEQSVKMEVSFSNSQKGMSLLLYPTTDSITRLAAYQLPAATNAGVAGQATANDFTKIKNQTTGLYVLFNGADGATYQVNVWDKEEYNNSGLSFPCSDQGTTEPSPDGILAPTGVTSINGKSVLLEEEIDLPNKNKNFTLYKTRRRFGGYPVIAVEGVIKCNFVGLIIHLINIDSGEDNDNITLGLDHHYKYFMVSHRMELCIIDTQNGYGTTVSSKELPRLPSTIGIGWEVGLASSMLTDSVTGDTYTHWGIEFANDKASTSGADRVQYDSSLIFVKFEICAYEAMGPADATPKVFPN